MASIWATIRSVFKKKPKSDFQPGIIAAPLTLVARISMVDESKEREAIKLAEEALRRGYPAQAIVAYWKAARFFMEREQYAKALSMLTAILKLEPGEMDAALERIRACEGLDRKRDAAFACVYVAELHEALGEWEQA